MNISSVANLHPVADDYVGGEDGSIALDPSNAFVNSVEVQDITDRAMAYLEAGYPVHFSGPPGTGKTTLAFHVAAQLGRPTILLHGDHEFGSSDLIGRESGYSKSRVVDNYIGSVLKFQEEGCVKKTRERHAVREMEVDPSKSLCRRRLQTAMSCFGQKPRW